MTSPNSEQFTRAQEKVFDPFAHYSKNSEFGKEDIFAEYETHPMNPTLIKPGPTNLTLRKKSSSPASLSYESQVLKHTTVKWSIPIHLNVLMAN